MPKYRTDSLVRESQYRTAPYIRKVFSMLANDLIKGYDGKSEKRYESLIEAEIWFKTYQKYFRPHIEGNK